MNREILFRGKRVDNGGWVYGNLIINKECQAHRIVDGFGLTGYMINGDNICFGDFYLVDPATVGQFTGLLDQNGTKVFEGDILKGKYFWNGKLTRIIGIVTYESREYTLHGVKQYEGLIKPFDRTFEVIGNIHDTPELIKQS